MQLGETYSPYKGKLTKNTKLTEAKKSRASLKAELENAGRKILNQYGMGDSFDNYFVVDITPDGTRVEVRAELDYDDMNNLAAKLDSILQKYDEDAYFDMDEPGIMSAYLNKPLKEDAGDIPIDDKGVARYGVDGKWWYFTTHGVQPGSIPKGIQVLEIKDTPNGTFFASDRVLNTSELNEYDIKEKKPTDME